MREGSGRGGGAVWGLAWAALAPLTTCQRRRGCLLPPTASRPPASAAAPACPPCRGAPRQGRRCSRPRTSLAWARWRGAKGGGASARADGRAHDDRRVQARTVLRAARSSPRRAHPRSRRRASRCGPSSARVQNRAWRGLQELAIRQAALRRPPGVPQQRTRLAAARLSTRPPPHAPPLPRPCAPLPAQRAAAGPRRPSG